MVGFNSSRFKTNKRQKIIVCVTSFVVLVCAICIFAVNFAGKNGNNMDMQTENNNFLSQIDSEEDQNGNHITHFDHQNDKQNAQNDNANEVATRISSSYAVMEGSRNILLDYQNATAKLPMASTTKVMTAYLACESGKLDQIVQITKESVCVEGSSIYLKEGEKYKLIDLVYGLMLQSGNDAAEAIARYLGGSIQGFADMMNEKAKSLGLKGTNFVNPHGLHDDNHYTTAYDLAYITCEALKNKDFAKICSTKVHKFQMPSGENKCYLNKNKLLNLYDGCIGVKTGFTKKAGRCLVSAAKRNGVTIVSVVLNEYDMWNRSMANLSKGFSRTESVLLAKANEVFARVESPSGQILNLGFKEDIDYTLLKNESLDVTYEINLHKNIGENVKIGENVGEIQFFNNKHLIFVKKIYTI